MLRAEIVKHTQDTVIDNAVCYKAVHLRRPSFVSYMIIVMGIQSAEGICTTEFNYRALEAGTGISGAILAACGVVFFLE